MAKLYFMQRQFEFLCLDLDEPIESQKIQLIFHDSWYWLHYRFFNCRASFLSETSAAMRMESERLSYRHSADKLALKRYRNEQADYNRRKKLRIKDQQRKSN